MFYTNLYMSQTSACPAEIQAFFNQLEIPRISPEDRITIDSNISSDEIIKAINSMQNGKAPGPDGLPIEF